MSTALYDFPLQTITGETSSLGQYRGKVLLIVNVASKCGLTSQYEALEKLYRRFRDGGFVVLGFPANDFAGQEPGTDEEIAQFCNLTYDVTFPMFSKIAVTGPDINALYKSLIKSKPEAAGANRSGFRERLAGFLGKTGATPNPEPGVLWNFEKFLVGRDGSVLARFSPEVTPDDPSIVSAVEAALAA